MKKTIIAGLIISVLSTCFIIPNMKVHYTSSYAERYYNRDLLADVVNDVTLGNIEKPIEIADDTLLGNFGIDNKMFETFYGVESSIENSIDTFIIVKCKNKNEKEVANLFNDYRLRISSNNSLRNIDTIDKAIVEQSDEYVIFSMLLNDNNSKIVSQARNLLP